MTTQYQPARRKIVVISPGFQGGTALAFALVAVAGWALFSWHLFGEIRDALRDVSFAAHYRFGTAYDIVGETVVRHVAALFAGVLLAGVGVFLAVVRKVRIGTERIAAIFRVSGEGDLSTPSDAPGPGDFAAFGKQVDAARASTLEIIHGIRAEVDLMRKEPLPEDEFARRWEGLKERIGRLAP